MRRVKYVLLASLLALIAFLAGCLFAPAPPTGTIEGYVVDAGAGSPVVGATVKAFPMDDNGEPIYWVTTGYFNAVATTDEDGHYKLILPKGRYVVVAEKDGYAVSRVEGVVVASTVKLDIIEKPVFNPDWSLEPPEVTVTIEGQVVTPGDELVLTADQLSNGLNYRVDAQGPNDIHYIYAALGKTPGSSWLTAPREIFESTYTTGDAVLDPANYGVEGRTTFEVVVYDMNGNRTHLIFSVVLPESAAPPSIQPPANLKALAVTLSKKVSFYNETITVPSGSGDIEIHAAPEGGNLYVELAWDASPDDASITGYRIYRKLEGEADYTLIGTVAAEGDPTATYTFRDASSELQVGLETTYQVRAYTGNTESAAVEASTIPLGMWDVRLLEPGNGATDVSLEPIFRWEPTKLVGNDQYYLWVLWDLALGAGYYIPVELLNETELAWSDLGLDGTPYERLQPHRVYQWYIGVAVAYDDFDDPTAISVAVQDGWSGGSIPVVPTLPATDLFTFTTGDWGE